MEARWKETPGFPLYEVSDCGDIRTWCRKGRNHERATTSAAIKPSAAANGYLRVNMRPIVLRPAGSPRPKPRTIYVHRLVAEAFVENPCGYPHVGHLDGSRNNNHFSNLVWCTAKINAGHKLLHGTQARGANVYGAKLCEQSVLAIAKLFNQEGWTQSRIAKLFGVTPGSVSAILLGKTWTHLHGEVI